MKTTDNKEQHMAWPQLRSVGDDHTSFKGNQARFVIVIPDKISIAHVQ